MADLKIKIKGDSKGLNNSIAKAKGTLNNFKSSLTSFMAGAGGGFLTGIAGGFGLVGKAAMMAKRAIDPLAREMDGIGKTAKRIGITATEFQALAFAARRTGSSTETVERAFKRMQKTITDSGRNLKTAEDAVSSIGLKYEDLAGISPEKQFEIIASRLNLVEDATKRAAIAQELFGRAGTNIAPLINEYKQLKTELKLIGGVIDESAIRSAEAYQDALENIATALKAIAGNSGIIGTLADSLQGQERALAEAKSPGGASGLLGAAKKVLYNPTAILDELRRMSESQGAKRQGAQIADILVNNITEGIKKVATGQTTKEEVAAAAGAFTAGSTVGGSIPTQLQALNKDQALAIGQMLTPLATMATDPQLSELVKMNATLRDIADAQRHQTDATNSYWEGELDNLFNDGA